MRMSLFVNAFREAGISPLNSRAIDESKFAPSMPYFSQPSDITPSQPDAKKLHELESLMNHRQSRRDSKRVTMLMLMSSTEFGRKRSIVYF